MDVTLKNNDGGTLYVVATPIGNWDDVTLRAIETLKKADWVVAEDTRHTRLFLNHFNIENRLISYFEHNEDERTPVLIEKLLAGEKLALVSTAGTPTVSDPGYRLISEAVKNNIQVVPIPGVSAVTTALSASGLPSDAFVFIGFLPRKPGKRQKKLENLREMAETVIIYESPKRISQLVDELIRLWGDRQAVLGREMTKSHEEFIRGRLTEIAGQLKQRTNVKGECTLLVTGKIEDGNIGLDMIKQELIEKLIDQDQKVSTVASQMADKYGISKKDVYKECLNIKKKGSR